MWYLWLIGAIVLIGYAIKKYFGRNQDYWKKRGVLHLKPKDGGFKSILMFLMKKKSMLEFDCELYNLAGDKPFGGTVDFGKPFLLIRDPDLIKQILVKDFDHFVDRRTLKMDSDPVLNKMLTSLEGQEWKNVRSHMSPTFTTGKIRRMFEYFNKSGVGLVEYMKMKAVGSPNTRDLVIKDFTARYLIDVIGATAFGMDTNTLKDEESVFYKMARRTSEMSVYKMLKAMLLVFFPFLTKFIRFSDEVIDFFQSILQTAIQNRVEGKDKRDDFVQMMLEARKGELKTDESELDEFEKNAQLKTSEKSKAVLTDDVILAQSLLFFLAGLDTTGTVLCFAFYLLALHPDIQEKLYKEVSKSLDATGGHVTYEDVLKMDYMDKVISEILRMYAIGTRLERRCTKEYKLPGTDLVIEKDVVVFVPVYAMQRDPELYPEPDTFDPERFTPEAKAARNPYTYMPFGQGPRNCIGMRFALMEAKVAIAYVVYNFFMEPSERTPVPLKLDPMFGARPDTSVEIRFKERIHN